MQFFNFSLTNTLKTFVLILLSGAVLIGASASTIAQVVDADIVKICVGDQAKALNNALRHHRSIGRQIATLKGLNTEQFARSRWTARELTDGLETYLTSVSGSALILYASDQTHFCAFLFQAGRPVLYSRTSTKLADINARIGKFRRLAAEKFHPQDRAASKRLANNRQRHVELTRGLNDKLMPILVTDKKAFRASQKSLSETLFPRKFRDALKQTDHLTIVPIGAITSLPIGLLTPFSDGALVIKEFSVNYLLFAGEVRGGSLKWNGKFQNPLIFANPKTDPNLAKRLLLGSIPATEKEVKDLADVIGADANRLLIGDKATKDTYLRRARDADLIYFASHAWSDPLAKTDEALDQSFIVLDELLTAREARIRLKRAKLVVMSACQTGLGVVVQGGIIGLARSFLDAGAGNVLMSLWNISDDGTRVFMHHFNRSILHYPPAEALRRAQLAMLDHPIYKHPAYWAAFSVYGNHGVRAP